MRSWLALLCACGIGCTAQYPAGVIVCSDASDCPSGMSCHVADDSREGRCFPGADADSGLAMDRKSPDASMRDAASDASDLEDASEAGPPAGESKPRAGSGGSDDKPRAGAGGSAGTAGNKPAAGSGGSAGGSNTCADPARACDAGDVDKAEGDCGQCGTGTRTRMRACNAATCSWGAWSGWSACDDPATCAPGTTESRMVACSGCGNKRQTRACSETTCKPGAWMDASSCTWCDACSEVVYCDTPDNIVANRGTWCRPQNGCNDDQAWGRCLEILKREGCTVHEPRYIGP